NPDCGVGLEEDCGVVDYRDCSCGLRGQKTCESVANRGNCEHKKRQCNIEACYVPASQPAGSREDCQHEEQNLVQVLKQNIGCHSSNTFSGSLSGPRARYRIRICKPKNGKAMSAAGSVFMGRRLDAHLSQMVVRKRFIT